tara:strand:- start:688 stop:894 length:207 start_codon:yes stop_codon:yes gene_type:complete
MIKDYQKKDIKKSPKLKVPVKREFDDGVIWAKAIKGAQNFGFFWKGKEILKPSREAAEAALNEIKKEI